jgi:hypothetical protein
MTWRNPNTLADRECEPFAHLQCIAFGHPDNSTVRSNNPDEPGFSSPEGTLVTMAGEFEFSLKPEEIFIWYRFFAKFTGRCRNFLNTDEFDRCGVFITLL